MSLEKFNSEPRKRFEKIKAYPDKRAISVRGKEWTLWIKCVIAKRGTDDEREMFLLKPLKTVYNQETKRFSKEEMCKPIWFEKVEMAEFMQSLAEM